MPDMQASSGAHDPRSAGPALADPPAAEQPPDPSAADPVTGAGQVTAAPEPGTQPPATAVPLALHAGWTMAVLYGRIEDSSAGGDQEFPAELPTEHELPPPRRRELELNRLRHLLRDLASLPDISGSGLPTEVPADDADERTRKAALTRLHLAIIEALAAAEPEVELAYELGRSLRDTVNPPQAHAKDPEFYAPALARQLARGRISKLQEWLATLSTRFPPHTAAVVSASLGRWSELAAVTVDTSAARLKRGDSTDVATRMCDYLLPQGDLWLTLLTGARSASGLLSPEGYVAAGELALRRSAEIVRRVLRHYAVALIVVAAALGGILYLAVAYLGGAAKVWTAIAAIGGSLGISAQTIASRASRLAAEAERPVFAMAEEDAMAWAITRMPPVSLTSRGVRHLRRSGIARSSSLGRV
jgi:hypothetical protein